MSISYSNQFEKKLHKTQRNSSAYKKIKILNVYSKPIKNTRNSFKIDPNQLKTINNNSIDNQCNEDTLRKARYNSVEQNSELQVSNRQILTNKENYLRRSSFKKSSNILEQLVDLPLNSSRFNQIRPISLTSRQNQIIVCNQCKENMPRENFFRHYNIECQGFRGYSKYAEQNVRENLKGILNNTLPIDSFGQKQQKINKKNERKKSYSTLNQENTVTFEDDVKQKNSRIKKSCPFCETLILIECYEDHINECRLFSIVDNLKMGYFDDNKYISIESIDNIKQDSTHSFPAVNNKDSLSITNSQFSQQRQAKSLLKNIVHKKNKIDQKNYINKYCDNFQDIMNKKMSNKQQLKAERDKLRENVKYRYQIIISNDFYINNTEFKVDKNQS